MNRPYHSLVAGAVLAIAFASPLSAQIWVSPTGDDTSGDGSSGNPFKTISHAATTASAGASIIACNAAASSS